MTSIVSRMKKGLRRAGDWITGHDVEVADRSPEAEELDSRATARPPIDVLEGPDELLVRADVPGAGPDGARVYVDGGRLSALARVAPAGEGKLLLGSAADANWRVDLSLPDWVDEGRIDASLRGGVLELRLPKSPHRQPRRIPVTSGR